MDATRLDTIAKFFAQHRLSRRRALAQAGAGVAAAGLAVAGPPSADAQDATPELAPPDAAHGPTMLFVQSFQAGSIAPTEGEEGRYTVTLEHGLGQTIYFSDRPDRIVGANPTEQFLAGLGFPADNPPNAALVVENASGETDLAVIELFAPVYDPAGPTVTYEVAVLANWQDSLEVGFTAAPSDLAKIEPSFGAAHLFIDDCGNDAFMCVIASDSGNPAAGTVIAVIPASDHDGWCYSWYSGQCLPCQPWYSDSGEARTYWSQQCNDRFADCTGDCVSVGITI